MTEDPSRSADPAPGASSTGGTPFCFITEDGATVTIALDPARSAANPSEALVRAKDAIRCLADAFGRAEGRTSPRPDEVGAVFRSWAYRS